MAFSSLLYVTLFAGTPLGEFPRLFASVDQLRGLTSIVIQEVVAICSRPCHHLDDGCCSVVLVQKVIARAQPHLESKVA